MGGRREVQQGGDICIPMIDSYCCMAETNTILKSNYLSIKNNNNNPPAPNTVIMVAGVVRAIIYEFGGLLIQSINTINNKASNKTFTKKEEV